MPEIALRQGRIHYREAGPADGPVALLIHGILVDGRLWDRVVPALAAAGLRVVVPDLPLGSHRRPLVPDADLSPSGVAGVIGDVVEALDLDDVTLVANDTGGAFSQVLLASDHPAARRIRALVLATVDGLEVFPPPALAGLPLLSRVPGGPALLARLLGWGPLRRGLFRLVSRAGIPDELGVSWTEPLRTDPAVLRDLAKLLAHPHKRWTLDAAPRLVGFDGPVLLAWARRDPFFPPDLAVRLAACFRDARIAWLDGTRTFVPWDRPQALAGLITDLVSEHAARPPVPA
jgi:pimeloyl-ACP methyl ester carboxylesterase